MLTYTDIHLLYILPAVGILTLITLPFINRWETSKIVIITAVALIYTTPCYNYSISNRARSYSPGRVKAVVGNVPVEEYLSVVLQTVLTSLWALLCLRWRLPFLNFNHDQRSYQLIRWIPILLLSVAVAVGFKIAVPGQKTFYLGSILYWASPVIMLMWYGAGNYFVRNIKLSFMAIVIPTIYLLWVNRIALKENVWHLNKATSLNVIAMNGLPLEEVLFTVITTTMVVLAGTCYDKAYGMIVTFSLIFPHQFSISWKFISQMYRAFETPEYSMPSIVTEDLKKCIEVLNSSSTFDTSNYLFHIDKLS
ncbi:hypothetical protein AGLY_012984 [Aphis glycines]|uniref:Uncharacterized protein n=1 Tax=Aphis glycines TaxID=307491 RepID=A0A6G0T8A2_APHGL|nr:hypothetical protein AGLY_012984 [Aphis glycines]